MVMLKPLTCSCGQIPILQSIVCVTRATKIITAVPTVSDLGTDIPPKYIIRVIIWTRYPTFSRKKIVNNNSIAIPSTIGRVINSFFTIFLTLFKGHTLTRIVYIVGSIPILVGQVEPGYWIRVGRSYSLIGQTFIQIWEIPLVPFTWNSSN